MIALLDNLPLVRLADETTLPFERDWLVRALGTAARKAGYPQWWLAEHVAESVTEYLRSPDAAPVLSDGDLIRAVQQVLQVIGYSEVGRFFTVGKPAIKISLVELAQSAGTGYELAFFDLLSRRLVEAIQGACGSCELYGLERCVKLLRSKKAWSRDCAALRDEIVSFAREQLGIAAATSELSLSLA